MIEDHPEAFPGEILEWMTYLKISPTDFIQLILTHQWDGGYPLLLALTYVEEVNIEERVEAIQGLAEANYQPAKDRFNDKIVS